MNAETLGIRQSAVGERVGEKKVVERELGWRKRNTSGSEQ